MTFLKAMSCLDAVLGSEGVTWLIGVVTFILFYWYATRNHDFWKKRGIPYVKPLPFVGSSLEALFTPLNETLIKREKAYGPIYGYFETDKPVLTVGDARLAREILVKDFQSFSRRRRGDTGDKLVDKMLNSLNGEDWKRVRSIITPTFSTGKMKKMLGIFKECSATVTQNIKAETDAKKSLDTKRLFAAFTMDVIASSAFSTKIDSHNNPDNEFVKTGVEAFTPKITLRLLLSTMFPRLMKCIGLFSSSRTSIGSRFFSDVTLEIIQERKRTGQGRNDFLQLLIDTAKEVSEDEKLEEDIASSYADSNVDNQLTKTSGSKKKIDLTLDELVSQCVIFFLAGFHTTASTLSFTTYLLALHQDVQEKLHQEVESALKASNGELSYEVIQDMKYLDKVLLESMRMYPPSARLERISDVDHKLADTGLVIPKETPVMISTITIHYNPKYYPDPEKFDPERFASQARTEREPYTYIPFGAGPRHCVGMRFAILEIKTCLAYIVANFKFNRSQKTMVPLKFDVGFGSLLQPRDITVDVELRKNAPVIY